MGYEIDAADRANQRPVDALKPRFSRKQFRGEGANFGKTSMKTITVLLLLTIAGLSMPAQAAEPQTLSCEGTKTGYGGAEPQKLSTNLLLNFTAEKIESSESPFLNGGKIVQVTETTVYLDSQIFKDDKLDISTGSLDRATGVLVGDAVTYKGDTARADRIVAGYRFSLKCAPLQR